MEIKDEDLKIKNPIKYAGKGDCEVVADYLKPSNQCELCCNEDLGYKINKDYAEGIKFYTLLTKYKDEYFQVTGNELTMSILKNHFGKHFNAKGAAVATYNQLVSLEEDNKPPRALMSLEDKPALLELFESAKGKHINDFTLLDVVTKNLIYQIQELEDIKTNKKESDPTFNTQFIIQQQFTIFQSLYMNALNKTKTFQKGKLQQAKIETLQNFNVLGIQNYQLDKGIEQSISKEIIEETQKMFAKITIKSIVEILLKTLDALSYTSETKAIFLKSFQSNLKGVEKNIMNEFQKYIDETFDKNKAPKEESNSSVMNGIKDQSPLFEGLVCED